MPTFYSLFSLALASFPSIVTAQQSAWEQCKSPDALTDRPHDAEVVFRRWYGLHGSNDMCQRLLL
jgi:hypothetical protein